MKTQQAGVEATQKGGSTMVRNKAPREAEQATSRGHSAQQQAVGVSPQGYAQRAAGDNADADLATLARPGAHEKQNKQKGNTENGEKQQHPVAGTHANETNNTRIYKQIVYSRAVVQMGK